MIISITTEIVNDCDCRDCRLQKIDRNNFKVTIIALVEKVAVIHQKTILAFIRKIVNVLRYQSFCEDNAITSDGDDPSSECLQFKTVQLRRKVLGGQVFARWTGKCKMDGEVCSELESESGNGS